MDPRVTELQCIMPIENIASIMAHGILSYERAAKLQHKSVAMQAVQDRRDTKIIPSGLKLHQYANLYFHARNPMMYKRRGEANHLCVLRISTDVFTIKGTVLSDQNAASNWVRFYAPSQWAELPFDDIFARFWIDQNDALPIQLRKKSCKCAEVLVPHIVEPRFLFGAYVIDATVKNQLQQSGFTLPVTVNPDLFFQA